MIDPKIQEELKKKLLDEKARIENSLAGSDAGKKGADREYQTNFPEIDRDQEENADEMEMYESALATDESLKEELGKIDDALSAIEKGTYGFCQNCQEDIPLERLRAYPQARSCIACKTK